MEIDKCESIYNHFPNFDLQYVRIMKKSNQTQRCNQMLSFTKQLCKLEWTVLCREFISLVNVPLQQAVIWGYCRITPVDVFKKHTFIFYDILYLLL